MILAFLAISESTRYCTLGNSLDVQEWPHPDLTTSRNDHFSDVQEWPHHAVIQSYIQSYSPLSYTVYTVIQSYSPTVIQSTESLTLHCITVVLYDIGLYDFLDWMTSWTVYWTVWLNCMTDTRIHAVRLCHVQYIMPAVLDKSAGLTGYMFSIYSSVIQFSIQSRKSYSPIQSTKSYSQSHTVQYTVSVSVAVDCITVWLSGL